MNSFSLKPLRVPRQRLSLSGVVPSRLASMELCDVRRYPILRDGQPATLGEWFEISKSSQAGLFLEGDLRHCDQVGGGLDGGLIVVDGTVGDRLAEGMVSGKLVVRGSAGHFAGSALRGGEVWIEGNAGEYAAAAAAGRPLGMQGGAMVIQGACGAWAASRMRRGVLVVHGHVGPGAATRMIAGTCVFCSDVSTLLGSGMRRGTIILADHSSGDYETVQLPPGYTVAEINELSFLPILLRQILPYLPARLQTELSDKPFSNYPRRVLRSVGDRAEDGLGELIWLHAQPDQDTNHWGS